MKADEIRKHYGEDSRHMLDCDVQLDTMAYRYSKGDALALLAGIIYADIGRRPLPDWLFEALIEHLSEMACQSNQAPLARKLRRKRDEVNQEQIDQTRYACLLHIRNLQGKGQKNAVTKGLNPDFSRRWLSQFPSFDDVTDWGKRREDAFGIASLLLEKTPYQGGPDTMETAFKRFNAIRRGAVGRAAYPDPLKKLLHMSLAIHEGCNPKILG